jgi:raffinose/stachyose/melibiose transport system substrate-binding protein
LYVITHDYVGYPYIYYNPKIFQTLGLSEPQKLDDLYSLVDKVKKAGYLGISWGLGTAPPWAANQFTFAVSNLLTSDEFADFSNNYGLGLTLPTFKDRKVKFNDPSMVKAWQMMSDWGKNLYVDGFTGAGDSDAISLFAQGKAAMYQTGSWGPALLDPVVKDFDYGMFNIPTDFGTNPGHIGSVANCLAISAKTHSPDVCTGFANFMLSEAEQAWMSSVAGGFPARIGIPPSEITNPKMGKGYQMFSSFTPSLVFGVSLNPKVVSELVATLQTVLNQSTKPTDAANHMEDYAVKASGMS